MLSILLTALLSAQPTVVQSGSRAPEVTPTGAPAPSSRISQGNLRADFDQAIGFIEAFAVHKDLNQPRLGIDYPREFAKLRKQIGPDTDLCRFRTLLGKALNLVQDLHAGYMDHEYLQQYGKLQSRFNISSDESYAVVAELDKLCPAPKVALDLPLMFKNGRYVTYADFDYRGVRVRRGTEVTTYDGQAISDYIKGHLDTVVPVRVDHAGNIYSLRFYRSGGSSFRLGLNEGRTLAMNLGDTIEWVTPQRHNLGFGSQTEANVRHFPEQRLLYIGIPMMDESFVEPINEKVDKIVAAGGTFDRIAIDIRGNPGGSDMTWRRVLSHLVGRPLRLTLDLRMKDSALARQHFRQPAAVPAKPVSLLGGAKYWLHNGNTIEWEPDPNSLRFSGPIFVLRDSFIYSSAANFSSFSDSDPQLISLGHPSDLVGGAQIEPLFFKLDHSGLVFRLEPALDFSGVRRLSDFAHNHVEIPVEQDLEDSFIRSTYEGDIYGRDFLMNVDPLIRRVLAHSPTGHIQNSDARK